MIAWTFHLKVCMLNRPYFIDLPELTYLQIGPGSFAFKETASSSVLRMRSCAWGLGWEIDLPILTTIKALILGHSYSDNTFRHPRRTVAESERILLVFLVDIPSLTSVVLPNNAFLYKNDVKTKSGCFLLVFLVDIPQVLLKYLT